MCILHVFSYYDYIMEYTNEPWFDPFYSSFIKLVGVSSYPYHHKEVNYSTEKEPLLLEYLCQHLPLLLHWVSEWGELQRGFLYERFWVHILISRPAFLFSLMNLLHLTHN